MIRTAVIIVHYKTPAMLTECIDSVRAQIDPALDAIVVIDNASGEEHVAPLRGLPGITLIESPKNLGFAGANNVGIRHIQSRGGARHYMLLNPDTLVRPGAFKTLGDFLESHPEAACVGPRLEYPDGAAQLSAFGDPTPISELVRGANIGPITRLFKRWEVYGQVQDNPHRCDWLAGACVLMRSEMIDHAGLLDDGYFMYFEEVDYFRRARKLGLQAWYEPRAHVVHLVGQSSGVTGQWAAKRLPSYWFESRHRYFRKHFGYLGMLSADALWLTGHLMMRARRLLTGVSHSAVAKSETRDLLRHSLREMFRPRIGGTA